MADLLVAMLRALPLDHVDPPTSSSLLFLLHSVNILMAIIDLNTLHRKTGFQITISLNLGSGLADNALFVSD